MKKIFYSPGLIPYLVLNICTMLWLTPITSAAEYAELQSQAIAECNRIPDHEFETGLWLNPKGYQSFYKRSACYQRTAIEFRNPLLCEQVRRRYALFSSSWGYSESHCQEEVATGISEDRETLSSLREGYLASPVSPRSLTVEKNGNGRDFDFIPRFNDGFAHGYQLRFELTTAGGDQVTVLVHGGYLSGSNDNLRLYLRQDQLLQRFPQLELGVPYPLTFSVTLALGPGRPGAWMRDDIAAEIFPEHERTQQLNTVVTFL